MFTGYRRRAFRRRHQRAGVPEHQRRDRRHLLQSPSGAEADRRHEEAGGRGGRRTGDGRRRGILHGLPRPRGRTQPAVRAAGSQPGHHARDTAPRSVCRASSVSSALSNCCGPARTIGAKEACAIGLGDRRTGCRSGERGQGSHPPASCRKGQACAGESGSSCGARSDSRCGHRAPFAGRRRDPGRCGEARGSSSRSTKG